MQQDECWLKEFFIEGNVKYIPTLNELRVAEYTWKRGQDIAFPLRTTGTSETNQLGGAFMLLLYE